MFHLRFYCSVHDIRKQGIKLYWSDQRCIAVITSVAYKVILLLFDIISRLNEILLISFLSNFLVLVSMLVHVNIGKER